MARETDAAADRAVAKEPDPFDAEYDMLVHDVKAGVAPRGRLGQAFSRDALGGKSVEYQGLLKNGEKRRFKQRWGEARLEVFKQQKFKSVVLKREHIQKGTYLPADIIVDKEGGGALRASALKAATAYITKCITLRGVWCKYNRMTER